MPPFHQAPNVPSTTRRWTKHSVHLGFIVKNISDHPPSWRWALAYALELRCPVTLYTRSHDVTKSVRKRPHPGTVLKNLYFMHSEDLVYVICRNVGSKSLLATFPTDLPSTDYVPLFENLSRNVSWHLRSCNLHLQFEDLLVLITKYYFVLGLLVSIPILFPHTYQRLQSWC
jgi:hypothetical protein